MGVQIDKASLLLELLNNGLRFYIKNPDYSSKIKFPKWSEIYDEYNEVPFNSFVSVDGLFSSDFLHFFFQYNDTFKKFIYCMDERHHYLIHFYIHFLP